VSYKLIGEIYCFHFGAKEFFPEDGGTFSVETSARFYLNIWHDTSEAANLTSCITDSRGRVLRIVEAQECFLSLVTSHFSS
jgi:hypothetical protein